MVENDSELWMFTNLLAMHIDQFMMYPSLMFIKQATWFAYGLLRVAILLDFLIFLDNILYRGFAPLLSIRWSPPLSKKDQGRQRSAKNVLDTLGYG